MECAVLYYAWTVCVCLDVRVASGFGWMTLVWEGKTVWHVRCHVVGIDSFFIVHVLTENNVEYHTLFQDVLFLGSVLNIFYGYF